MASVNLERLNADIRAGGAVYDPVPESERHGYSFWRGLSLGRLALELTRGNFSLELDSKPVHFGREYPYAVLLAGNIAQGAWYLQTPQRVCAALECELGVQLPYGAGQPALIVAHHDPSPMATPSNTYLPFGFKIGGPLTSLDPHSQQFIEDYFQVSLRRGDRKS